MRASLAAVALVFVSLGGADGALRVLASSLAQSAEARGPTRATQSAPAAAQASAPALLWTIDIDRDGLADFANPTHGGVRGIDAFGSGVFGAVRDAGKRRHHGVDYVAAPGALVRAPIAGKVTQIGFAYGGADRLRYVEIANPETRLVARVLYVAPSVALGDVVLAGGAIGVAQDLRTRYPGITNHVHVELRDRTRRLLDATDQLPSTPVLQTAGATVTDAAS